MEKNIALLLESLYELYGFDFREYSSAHVRRRINNCMTITHHKTVEDLHAAILTNKQIAASLLQDLSVTVTEMFRDADFFTALRKEVVPILRTYPFIKIWHAGCSTGQEAYSMAILLYEEGLYDKTTLYATDFNERALDEARAGIFDIDRIQDYEHAYKKSGGTRSLSAYYTSKYDRVIMNSSIKKNIVWANHNLVTDTVFAEVNLVLCRNVLIYFDRSLQNKVQQLFYDSLVRGGTLCLGSKESIKLTEFDHLYTPINERQRIYKKIISGQQE